MAEKASMGTSKIEINDYGKPSWINLGRTLKRRKNIQSHSHKILLAINGTGH
jgi:hypothetical protein